MLSFLVFVENTKLDYGHEKVQRLNKQTC